MTGGWVLALKCHLTELDLRCLLQTILQGSLVADATSIAPSAPEEPFRTDPVEHLLDNGHVLLSTAEGSEVTLTRGMVLGGFRDWASWRIEMGLTIPACLSDLDTEECKEILAAVKRSQWDVSDYYEIDRPDTEGVPEIYLDRQAAHDRFMSLYARYGVRLMINEWDRLNAMTFDGVGDTVFSLTGRGFDDSCHHDDT